MRNFLFFIPFFLACSCNNPDKTILKTPLEQSEYKNLSGSEDIGYFLKRCEKLNPKLSVEVVGNTPQGKPLYLLKNFEQPNKKHITVFLFAQQHGNEPSGKEGLLLLVKDLAEGKLSKLTRDIDLLIMPQTNPDGGDKNNRRNSQGTDLNRNHLILTANESQIIQNVFHAYRPEITVDFHEYYPYSKSWEEFGYRRNFDIQFGGLTNINIDSTLRNYFYSTVFNQVKNEVESKGYTFFEYTLGGFPHGERLRHSTVDVNDGRQSMGITNTLSFIVEGKRGRDSLHLIERRTKSQFHTALGILKVASKHTGEIKQLVAKNRNKLKSNYADSVVIRMDHFKGSKPLHYPLVSVKSENDTVFIVDEFHSEVRPLLKVKTPKGYLIPKNDTLLVDWLGRSNFYYSTTVPKNSRVYAYRINQLKLSEDEGLENIFAQVTKKKLAQVNTRNFLFVPTLQIYQYKIATALEPQAMYGLVNYPEFEYLINNDTFPVLRVE